MSNQLRPFISDDELQDELDFQRACLFSINDSGTDTDQLKAPITLEIQRLERELSARNMARGSSSTPASRLLSFPMFRTASAVTGSTSSSEVSSLKRTRPYDDETPLLSSYQPEKARRMTPSPHLSGQATPATDYSGWDDAFQDSMSQLQEAALVSAQERAREKAEQEKK
jgi:hypothetical protein